MPSSHEHQEQQLFQSVRDYYATPHSLEHYTRYAREVGLYPPERAMIERFLAPPASVLDIGCGAGREAFALARMGYTVRGVDICEPFIERARALASDLALPVEFHVSDGRCLPFADALFDYVLLITQMIQHVPLRANRVHLLREAGRVVRPAGRILLTYHDHDILKTHTPWGGQLPPDATAQQLAAALDVLEPRDSFTGSCQGTPTDAYGYVHNHTRQEMESEVRQAGLRIVDRAAFRTIAGGEPDDFWKPTQILVLARAGQ